MMRVCCSISALLLGALLTPARAQEAAPAPPCEQQPYSIAVTISNIKEARGVVHVELYDDVEEHFLRGFFRLSELTVPAEQGEMKVCVPTPKAGPYAIAVFHDRNANNKFDKNFLGIPIEPFGVSNNPPMRARAPRVDEALIDVTGRQIPINVQLRSY